MPSAFRTCRSNPRFIGDPIDVVTGANTDAPVDLVQRGPILFQWVRYYSSARSKIHCSLGWGQSHDFDCLLHRDIDGLRYEDPLGSSVGFPDLAIDGNAGSSGMLLTRAGEHFYVVSRPGQPDEEFEFSRGFDNARLARLRQDQNTIELRYADRGGLREIVDSRGRLIRVTTDLAGRIVQLALVDPITGALRQTLLAYEYDIAGNLVRATDLYKTTLTFAYDAANRMTRRTDRRGYSFHFAYDEQGRCVHSRGDDGLLEVFLDYQPDLKTTFVRRGDGGQWTYFYDAAGTVTQITDPYGGASLFTVDETGRVTEEIDPNGNTTQLLYDDQGHHYARIDPLGHELPPSDEDPELEDPLSYVLPESPLEWEFGDLVDAEDIREPGNDDPILSLLSPGVVNTILEHTASYAPGVLSPTEAAIEIDDPILEHLGQSLEEPGPRSAQRWQFDPNGMLAEYRDRDGSIHRFTYASWNLPHQEIDPLGNTTTFVHAPNLQLAKVIDPGGTEHKFIYDLKDRLTEIHYEGRLLEQFRYDRAENMIEKRNGNGRTLVSWEIGDGNLDKVRRLGTGEIHQFQHDESGRIIQAIAPEGTVVRAYDEDGWLIQDQRDGLGVEHEFNLNQISATKYLGKFLASYGFDDNGDHIITDPTGAVHRTKVSDNGLLLRQFASGTREVIQFDVEGRCRLKAILGGGDPSMRRYSYSPEGDLRTVADSRRGVIRYDYDEAHRLMKEHLPSGARDFAYDAAGNLLLQPSLDQVEIEGGNRLRSANGDSFSYDDRDNLETRVGPPGSTRYQYDDLDRLVHCDLNGQPWTATYDALCRRVNKTWQGQTTTYYWDGFRLAAERRGDGSLRLYVYEDHIALVPLMFVEYAGLDAEPASGKRYYIFTDQIGVPIRVEDANGRPCWTARIDPYGRAEVSPGSTVEMPLRFPGHYHDSETGLHYNCFRYYSPELGRYLQPDPMGIEGGINLFAYVYNPLIEVDLDGLTCPPGKKPPTKKPPKAMSSKKPPAKKPKSKADKKRADKKRKEIDKKYRKLIDNPPKGKTADDMRYKRHKARSKAAGAKPMPRDKWNKSKEQADKNRKRGSDKEDKARKGLEEHTSGTLKNNNTGSPKTHTHNGTTTRPDSVGTDKDDKKVVHDHKDKSGKDKTIYNDEQMKAQQDMAGKDGRHVVTTSSDKPKLDADPPEPRPSKNLAEKSEVNYTDKDGNVTRTWNQDTNKWDEV